MITWGNRDRQNNQHAFSSHISWLELKNQEGKKKIITKKKAQTTTTPFSSPKKNPQPNPNQAISLHT